MSGVFLIVEIDRNEPLVFAFDAKLSSVQLSRSVSYCSTPTISTSMHVIVSIGRAHRLEDYIPQRDWISFSDSPMASENCALSDAFKIF